MCVWADRAGVSEAELLASSIAMSSSSSSSSSTSSSSPYLLPECGIEVLMRGGGGWGWRRGVERDLLAALRSVMQFSR